MSNRIPEQCWLNIQPLSLILYVALPSAVPSSFLVMKSTNIGTILSLLGAYLIPKGYISLFFPNKKYTQGVNLIPNIIHSYVYLHITISNFECFDMVKTGDKY